MIDRKAFIPLQPTIGTGVEHTSKQLLLGNGELRKLDLKPVCATANHFTPQALHQVLFREPYLHRLSWGPSGGHPRCQAAGG